MHVLNRVLPLGVRRLLREVALRIIPSMRHLDTPRRLRHLASLGFAPRTIFDVGAAEGEWSRMAAAIWPGADLVGFEGRASSAPALEATQRALAHFRYHRCFLGARSGRTAFADRGHQTSFYATADGGDQGAEMRTLDEMSEAGLVPQPDFIKLDVQGYEIEVLSGAPRLLGGVQAVLAETSFYRFHPSMPTAADLIAWLEARGFAIYDVMELIRLPEDDALGHLDFLFLRADHPLRRRRAW
jgi:FkbM family methyltransferase